MSTKHIGSRILAASLLAATLTAAATADEHDATLAFTNSGNTMPQPVDVHVQILNNDGTWATVHVFAIIPPLTPAPVKRDLIRARLEATFGAGSTINAGSNGLTLRVENGVALRVKFDSAATAEISDSVAAARTSTGAMQYAGFLQPFDYQNQPAVFTAGIMTDLGIATESVSAAELNFQTDGPIICQALFQRLAPRAPQYGAQINYAGDRLEVYFDPAYTVTQGGVIFGSTSRSPGCTGEIEVPPLQPPATPGDMNCDGVVDFADIDPFVAALTGQAAYDAQYPGCRWLNGDVNGDGVVDFADIDPFVALF